MPELIFNPLTHEYFVDGVKYPSVSEIISPLVHYSNVPEKNLEKARNYGTALHDTLKFYLKGTLDEDKLDEGLRLPLEGFKKWFNKRWREIIFFERPAYHNKLKYAGTPDLLIGDILYDFKSRPFNPITDSVQLEGYKELVINEGFHVGRKTEKGIYVLEFDLEGNVKVVNAYQKQAKSMWNYLLEFSKTLEGWRNQK